MKKYILTSLALLGAVSLASCAKENPGKFEEQKEQFKTTYEYTAISGINLMEASTPNLKRAKELSQENKDKIITNLQMVDGLIEGGITKSEEKESDKAEYEKMYVITLNELIGTSSYTFYYNETLDQEQDDDDDDDLLELEQEQDFRLDGLVVKDGVEYKMHGEKEIEGNEMEVEFKIAVDDANFVIVEQEKESGEEEYSYKKYTNGRKVYETEVEFERENNKVEFEFKEKNADGVTKYKYEIVNNDGERYIKVIMIEGNEQTIAKVKETTDEAGNKAYEFF